MKKHLLLLAVAVAALASCSNDETVATNQTLEDANTISFRALTTGMTRAADINATGLQTSGFKAFANVYGSSTEGANYFPETAFSWNGNSYTSDNKYYWPAEGALNFYAWSSSGTGQVTHEATTKVFVVEPAALSSASTASTQTDLVIANTNNKSKTGEYKSGDEYNSSAEGKDKKYGADGIPLNFRHAESKVAIMIKNTNPNLKFTVGDVEIGNLYGSGTYTYPGDGTSANAALNTDGNDAGNLSLTNWSYGTATQTTDYSLTMKSDASYNVFNGTTAAKNILDAAADYEMILIPQTFLVRDVYSGTDAHVYTPSETEGSPFAGSYISAQIKIQNKTNDAYIVGGASKYVKAIWPLPAMSMNPGYKYTFTIDLAGGGYYYDNQDANTDLDPILEGAEIKFVTVTVDGWDDGGTHILGNVIKGGTYTFNEAATAAGTYYIYVSGLTSGSTLAASLTTAGNLSDVSVIGTDGNTLTTTPASGVATIKVTLAANSTASKVPGTISFTESGGATSTTTINIVQAAAE